MLWRMRWQPNGRMRMQLDLDFIASILLRRMRKQKQLLTKKGVGLTPFFI